MAANPVDVLGLVYRGRFRPTAVAARSPLLALGNVAFSLVAVSGAILNGAGQAITRRSPPASRCSSRSSATTSRSRSPPRAVTRLEAAAAVTGGAMLVGAIAYGIVLHRQFGAFLPVLSVIRVAARDRRGDGGRPLPAPHGKLMTLVEAVVVVGVFLVVLVITRELGARDVAAIKAVRAKRSPQGEATDPHSAHVHVLVAAAAALLTACGAAAPARQHQRHRPRLQRGPRLAPLRRRRRHLPRRSGASASTSGRAQQGHARHGVRDRSCRPAGRGQARAQVKVSWYLDSEQILRETSAIQTWVKKGQAG